MRPDFAMAAKRVEEPMIHAITIPSRTYMIIKELLEREQWPRCQLDRVYGNGTCLGLADDPNVHVPVSVGPLTKDN